MKFVETNLLSAMPWGPVVGKMGKILEPISGRAGGPGHGKNGKKSFGSHRGKNTLPGGLEKHKKQQSTAMFSALGLKSAKSAENHEKC